jgi:ParB-like chromosome segregation protein Spo0J
VIHSTLNVDGAQDPGVIDALKTMPVSNVEWVDPATLTANDYNPNHVAPPELRLLRLSILEDGWTQPIVARPDGEIVDGFHRWQLGSTDPEVRDLTGGLVPVARLVPEDAAHQRMSTIRHNRARGTHHVVKTADIVADLREQGLDDETIMRRLQMDREEFGRLADRGDMRQHAGRPEFTEAWKPGRTSVR